MNLFIDSNIPMYAAGSPHPHKAPAVALLERIRSGSISGCTSTEVLQEILYRYSKLGRREGMPKVYDLFVRTCPIVFGVTLADTDAARDLLTGHSSLSARDAVDAAVMRNHGVAWIASYDQGFDQIPGIRRWDMA